jgi:putative effector of murein hydrolase
VGWKKEGLHLIDFYRVEKHSFWRELPLFLLLTLLAGPIAMLPNAIFGNLFFGDAALTAEMMWRALMFLPFALYIGAILNWRPRLLPYFMVVHGLLDASLFLFLLPAAY